MAGSVAGPRGAETRPTHRSIGVFRRDRVLRPRLWDRTCRGPPGRRPGNRPPADRRSDRLPLLALHRSLAGETGSQHLIGVYQDKFTEARPDWSSWYAKKEDVS